MRQQKKAYVAFVRITRESSYISSMQHLSRFDLLTSNLSLVDDCSKSRRFISKVKGSLARFDAWSRNNPTMKWVNHVLCCSQNIGVAPEMLDHVRELRTLDACSAYEQTIVKCRSGFWIIDRWLLRNWFEIFFVNAIDTSHKIRTCFTNSQLFSLISRQRENCQFLNLYLISF